MAHFETWGCSSQDPCKFHLKERAEGWQRIRVKTPETCGELEKQLKATEKENDRLRAALKEIATFGHAPDCACKGAPIYECSCWEYTQWYIAQQALDGK